MSLRTEGPHRMNKVHQNIYKLGIKIGLDVAMRTEGPHVLNKVCSG